MIRAKQGLRTDRQNVDHLTARKVHASLSQFFGQLHELVVVRSHPMSVGNHHDDTTSQAVQPFRMSIGLSEKIVHYLLRCW